MIMMQKKCVKCSVHVCTYFNGNVKSLTAIKYQSKFLHEEKKNEVLCNELNTLAFLSRDVSNVGFPACFLYTVYEGCTIFELLLNVKFLFE